MYQLLGKKLLLKPLTFFFNFFELGNVPWSEGQSSTLSPWDFMRKNKAEQVTVLLSGKDIQK